MRDPDRPRGNPLFDDLDAGLGNRGADLADDPTDAASDGASGARNAASGETSGANDHTFGGTRHDGAAHTTDAEAGVRALFEALMAAGPETTDHLLRAMEELLLAARTVMVAAEEGIVEQRAAHRPTHGFAAGETGDDSTTPDDGGSAHSGFSSIDLD
ncbi:MAG: hypothetical protein R3A49_03995 [Acidimicrobiia bacterium]